MWFYDDLDDLLDLARHTAIDLEYIVFRKSRVHTTYHANMVKEANKVKSATTQEILFVATEEEDLTILDKEKVFAGGQDLHLPRGKIYFVGFVEDVCVIQQKVTGDLPIEPGSKKKHEHTSGWQLQTHCS